MKHRISLRAIIIITLLIVLAFGAYAKFNGFHSSYSNSDETTLQTLTTKSILDISSGKITIFDSIQNNTILSQHSTSLILNRHFTLEGPIVAAKPFHACHKIENTHLITNQTIVLVSDYWAYSCHPKTKIKNVQDTGAAGIIVSRDGGEGGGGFLAHYMWPEDKSWIHINGVETASSDLEKKVKKNTEELDSNTNTTNYYVTVSPGVNQYQQINNPVYQFFLGVNALESLITLGLAIYKLRGFIQIYGLEASVSQMCLSLEIVASSLRMIAWIDPLFSRGVYPYGLGVFCIWLVQPFMFGILLMVSFYWEQCISSNHVEAMPSLRKFRYPFIALCTIIALCYWINGIVRALFLSQKYPVVAVNVFLNGIISIGVSIFYITVGSKVLRFLWTQKNLNRKNRDLRMTTVMIMISALLLILFSVFTFAFLSQPHIHAVVALFCIQFHIANGIALSLVIAFRVPRPGSSSSHQTASNNSSKKEATVSKYTTNSSYSAKTENEVELDEDERQTPASTVPSTSTEEPSVTVQEVEDNNSRIRDE